MEEKNQFINAEWTMDIIPGRASTIYVTNLAGRPIFFNKNLGVAYESMSPDTKGNGILRKI